nr:DUF2199 domain-containing protein [Erythrobacter ani]
MLENGTWRCGICEAEHGWPFDLACGAPDVWPHEKVHEQNSALRWDGDFLSEDFCVLDGQHFMVRTVLMIPVIGLKDQFGFGCWSSLSRANFEKYIDGFDSGQYADLGPWDGWLMNRFKYFQDEPDPIAVDVQPKLGRLRPELSPMDDAHPLAVAQRDGISPEQMLEIFAHYGHAPETKAN